DGAAGAEHGVHPGVSGDLRVGEHAASSAGVCGSAGDAATRRSGSGGKVRRDFGTARAGREDRWRVDLCDGAVRGGDDGAPRGVFAEPAEGTGRGCERSGGSIADAAGGGTGTSALRVEPDRGGVSERSVHPRVVRGADGEEARSGGGGVRRGIAELSG